MPRAATTARSSSVSKNSATRSATAIGPQRSRRKASLRGSPRNLRPTPSRCHSSEIEGSSIEGGVIVRSGSEDLADLGRGCRGTRVALRVVRRDLLELAGRARGVVVEGDAAAVRGRREDADLRLDEREAVLLEAEVADDRGQEGPGRVEDRRDLEPRGELFGDGDAADDLRFSSTSGFKPAFARVAGRDEAVVPAADDDDVFLLGHLARPSRASSLRGASRRRSCRWRP